MSESQCLSSHGFTLLYRLSPTSTVQVKPSQVALQQLVAAGLAELSDQPDGKLDDIQVTREGYKAEFMPLRLPSCQFTVLSSRQGPIKCKPRSEEKLYGKFDDYGGYFERANFIGIYLVHVGAAAPEEPATASSFTVSPERARIGVSLTFTPTPPPREGDHLAKAMPTADRKKQLYRSLFDEDEDAGPATDSSSKENAKISIKKSADARTSSQGDVKDGRSRKYKQTLLAMRESGGRHRASPSSVEPYSPPSRGQINADSVAIPSYRPAPTTKLSQAEEYVPEYVASNSDKKKAPIRHEKQSVKASVEYVPTKVSKVAASMGRIPRISGYVPQSTKSSSNSTQAVPTYKPGVKRAQATVLKGASVDEYEPVLPPGQPSLAYRPSKRANDRNEARTGSPTDAYEPSGGAPDSSALEYHPSRITRPPGYNESDDCLALRTRKRNFSPSRPPASSARRVSSVKR